MPEIDTGKNDEYAALNADWILSDERRREEIEIHRRIAQEHGWPTDEYDAWLAEPTTLEGHLVRLIGDMHGLLRRRDLYQPLRRQVFEMQQTLAEALQELRDRATPPGTEDDA